MSSMSCLCVRLKAPNRDEYKKLARIMRYIWTTIDLLLNFESDRTNILKWFMNGDFSIHSDMKSRIRGGLTLEKVKAYATSTRQKIIFYISTKADLVGMDNIMPQLFWTHYFMEAQGLKIMITWCIRITIVWCLLKRDIKGRISNKKRYINIICFSLIESRPES